MNKGFRKNYNYNDIKLVIDNLKLGLSREQIAKKLNVGVDKVRRIIIRNNINIIVAQSQRKLNKINKVKQKDFEYFYYKTNLSVNDICKKFNITIGLYNILRIKYSCNKKGNIYYENNKDRLLKEKKEKRKNYDIVNKKKLWKKNRIYYKDKYYNDINYKMKEYIRNSIRHRIKHHKGIKAAKTEVLLGCSIQQLRQHLESQFRDGMSWKNFGHKGWHMDHIIPCSKFDLTRLEEQKKCFHYTNYQPLWWYENLQKRDKILNEKQQEVLV